MSLINDMLRDLDQRKSAYPQQQGVAEGVRVTPAANSRDRMFARNWVWLVAVVGVLLLAAFAWHLYGELKLKVLQSSELVVETNNAANEAPEPTVSQVIQAQPPAFSDILAVEVHAVTGGARIEISLSAPVQHRVLRNGQQLIIDLPATRLIEALPNLTRHPLISAVDVLTHAAGIQLEVDVTRPVNLQTSMISKQQTLLMVELIAADDESQNLAAGVAEITEQKSAENVVVDAGRIDSIPTSFEKTSRQLTLAERDKQAKRQALQDMRNGHTQSAEQLLIQLLDDYPEAHQSRATLIALRLSQEQLERAQQLLSQGLQLAPEQLAFIKLKARILLSQQQPSAAVIELDKHQQGERDQEYLALLATATQRDGQHQRAATLYQQLLQLNDWQAQWWVGLAISLEALNQKNAALKAYWQARELPGISPALKRYAEGRISQLK